MSNSNFYQFESIWTLRNSKEDAFNALERLSEYPLWWREVKSVTPVDQGVAETRCRSWLPYELVFLTRQTRVDAEAGVLEARLSGDIEGFSRWTVSSDKGKCRLLFEEEVVTNKAILNLLAPVGRPAFKLNHALMMHHGETGLRKYLEPQIRMPSR